MLTTGLAVPPSSDYPCHQNAILTRRSCQLFSTFPCIFKLNFNGLRQSDCSYDVLLGWCRLKIRQNWWLIWSSHIQNHIKNVLQSVVISCLELTWTITRALWSFIFIKWMTISKLGSILYSRLFFRNSLLSKISNRKNKINVFSNLKQSKWINSIIIKINLFSSQLFSSRNQLFKWFIKTTNVKIMSKYAEKISSVGCSMETDTLNSNGSIYKTLGCHFIFRLLESMYEWMVKHNMKFRLNSLRLEKSYIQKAQCNIKKTPYRQDLTVLLIDFELLEVNAIGPSYCI